MLVNETKNDLEFNVTVAKRLSGKSRLLVGIATLVFLAIGGLMLGLELGLPKEEEPDLFFGIFCLVCGAVFAVFFFGLTPFMRKLIKKNMQGKEGTVRTAFLEEGYEQTATLADGTVSTTRGDYASFTECREYPDLWLLYLNKATVFGLSKSGMTEGTAEELSAFLMQKLAYKYKTCFKRK